MAFSPAWGGTIPLVAIGSFKGFLAARRQGKDLKVWYTASISRAVTQAALRTAVGKRFVEVLQVQVLARFGYKPSVDAIGIELQAYIAFMRFQRVQSRNSPATSIRLDALMEGDAVASPLRSPAIPSRYFETMTRTLPRPIEPDLPTGETQRRTRRKKEDLVNWFDRRKFRKGRFRNA